MTYAFARNSDLEHPAAGRNAAADEQQSWGARTPRRECPDAARDEIDPREAYAGFAVLGVILILEAIAFYPML